jgi:glucose-1-phosphate cytidylyltransferase
VKTVILAGGLGSRLAEETDLRPKPMIEIGSRPILWHIMKCYGHHGFRDFYVALGYRGDVIKRWFLDYHGLSRNLTVELGTGRTHFHEGDREDWNVHLIDTGLRAGTGGRVRRLKPWLEDGAFFLTYGDGVSDVDLHALLAFHRRCGRLATLTAVRPPARFGGLVFEGDLVSEFIEKPQIGEGWVNGGFMVVEPEVLERIPGDDASLEVDLLEGLAREGQLAAYRHERFWQCMDTLRDLRLLESLWATECPPWKLWN